MALPPVDGLLLVLSAPSGAGKSTLVSRLMAGDGALAFSVSHTTRAPRSGEDEGVHYHFVTRDAFDAMVARGEFLEWAPVFDQRYGTSRAEVARHHSAGRDVVLDIDVAGARQIRASSPSAALVFVLPPDQATLRKRLERRGTDAGAEIEKRLGRAREEIAQADFYDYYVVNDDLDRAVSDLRAIVAAERCRSGRREPARRRVLETFPEAAR
ncbi:MAG: guanylate kinase [Acidobacteriota bacterium]